MDPFHFWKQFDMPSICQTDEEEESFRGHYQRLATVPAIASWNVET